MALVLVDLKTAGIASIQIDEAALCESGLLRASDGPDYPDWAARAFRVSASGLRRQKPHQPDRCASRETLAGAIQPAFF
ncbi:MAG: hypothetical protein ACTHNO_08885 [Ralstonia sp.]|uniref:hypothetical protein n=1 Tax=Ralstonia sp. TaxID=54061 RepID=UPI003F806EA4